MPEQTQELRMRMVAHLQDLYVALLIRRGGSTNNRSRVAAHLQDLYAALLIRRGGSAKAPISRSVCRDDHGENT